MSLFKPRAFGVDAAPQPNLPQTLEVVRTDSGKCLDCRNPNDVCEDPISGEVLETVVYRTPNNERCYNRKPLAEWAKRPMHDRFTFSDPLTRQLLYKPYDLILVDKETPEDVINGSPGKIFAAFVDNPTAGLRHMLHFVPYNLNEDRNLAYHHAIPVIYDSVKSYENPMNYDLVVYKDMNSFIMFLSVNRRLLSTITLIQFTEESMSLVYPFIRDENEPSLAALSNDNLDFIFDNPQNKTALKWGKNEGEDPYNGPLFEVHRKYVFDNTIGEIYNLQAFEYSLLNDS